MGWLDLGLKGLFDVKETEELEIKSFEDLCNKLNYPTPLKKQIEFMEFAFSGGIRLILGARGYGKSDYITVLGSVWRLYNNPHFRILIMAKEYKRGLDIMESIISNLKLLGLKMSSENKTSIRLETLPNSSKDPSVGLATMRSKSLRGRHPDYIILDDPITPDDDSEVERERVQKVYSECLNLSKNICVIGQPVHEKDLYQTLRKASMVEKIEVWHGSIPLLDANIEELEEKGTTKRDIYRNYFGKLIPDDEYPFHKIEIADFPLEGYIYGFLDPSYGGEDFTALSFGYVKYGQNGQKTYFLGVMQWKEGFSQIEDEIIDVCTHLGIKHLFVENNGDHGLSAKILKTKSLQKNVFFLIEEYRNTQNKHRKILSVIGSNLNNIVLHSKSNCIDEIKMWNSKEKHDDHVDSIASLILAINKK
jgi:hypothetical protein